MYFLKLINYIFYKVWYIEKMKAYFTGLEYNSPVLCPIILGHNIFYFNCIH